MSTKSLPRLILPFEMAQGTFSFVALVFLCCSPTMELALKLYELESLPSSICDLFRSA